MYAELRRNRGVGPVGKEVYGVNNDSISENYAVTLMIGLYGAQSRVPRVSR